ncbi:hypothetical protein S40293_09911 [Stachybotrys chartarum IBT 40293]|nr:hypothetical protein S40293_09911 [Stachybotrys chartarum IBT 40293]
MWMDKQPRAEGLPALPPDPIHVCVEKIIELRWQELRQRAKRKRQPEPERPSKAGLCISIYKAQKANQCFPEYDAPYIIGFLTSSMQLGVAAIPYGIFGDWSILMVTASGIVLSFASGALPQWSEEKWACRINSDKMFVLTRGNSSQHAIVIQGAGIGLDLEDLAAADTGMLAQWRTRVAVVVLSILWIHLLIIAAGIKQNSWFLFAVGGMGILQNMYVAGSSRLPNAFGMPLEFVGVIGQHKVMEALFEVENCYPRLGQSMLPIFFSGELRADEEERWDNYKKTLEERKRRKERIRIRNERERREA